MKEPKYKRIFHEGMVEAARKEIKRLNGLISTIRSEARQKMPFGEGERVAVMDAATQKFMYFAFIKDIMHNPGGDSPFIVRYQRESKTGRKEKLITVLDPMVFLLDPKEADTSSENTWQMPDIKNLRI